MAQAMEKRVAVSRRNRAAALVRKRAWAGMGGQ
jgi:hypothetical protein